MGVTESKQKLIFLHHHQNVETVVEWMSFHSSNSSRPPKQWTSFNWDAKAIMLQDSFLLSRRFSSFVDVTRPLVALLLTRLFTSPSLTHSYSQSQCFCSVGLSAVSLLTSMLIANLPVWWFNGQRRHDLAFFSTANIFHEFEPRGFRDKHKPMHKLCRRLSAQLHLLNANRVQVQTHNLSCYRPHETLINLNILFAWKLRPISENLSLHVA